MIHRTWHSLDPNGSKKQWAGRSTSGVPSMQPFSKPFIVTFSIRSTRDSHRSLLWHASPLFITVHGYHDFEFGFGFGFGLELFCLCSVFALGMLAGKGGQETSDVVRLIIGSNLNGSGVE